MANPNTAISWFSQRQGKVTYSMGLRLGPGSFDCSSAVYNALIAAGYFPPGTMGNTESLFGHLESLGWQQTTSPVKGDVFIWGQRGASHGNSGHTGMFVNNKDIIHCNYGSNGISTDNYAQSHQYAGSPPAVVYHDPNNKGGSTSPRKTYSETEKNVIIMYTILKPLGYSLQAIAAKAGNADAESSLKPDTSELGGGPGYGIYQHTSPVYGESGQAYVQRLCKQAGIEEQYNSMEAQVKLGHWGMSNGQWIGVVQPATVPGFMQGTDVNQLTYAFLRNFERAGVERLKVRQAAAQKWYQFLVQYDLDPDPENAELPGNEEEPKVLVNAGEIEEYGIREGKAFAKGWHFSSNKSNQKIQVIDATNDKIIHTLDVSLADRPDIKEKYPDIEGVEKCGFDISFSLRDGQSAYLKGLRSDGSSTDELVFDAIIIYEPAEDAEINDYAQSNGQFWYEIIENHQVKFRGKHIISELSWSNELMYVPTLDLDLPLEYRKYFTGREEMKLYINQMVFNGLVDGKEEDTAEGVLRLQLVHVIDEWRYRQLSTNLACKNRTIMDIFSTYDFRYSKRWHVDFLQDAAKRKIDYVYSRQTKLDALTKTCNLTDDLFWRIGFRFGRLLEIGTFGEKKPYMISTKPSSNHNIRMIEEPIFTHEFSNVINIATVYGEKSDSGMSSMSLREIYFEPQSQKPGFPIRILRNAINNERGYDYVNYTQLAPNNAIEFSVIDEESIRVESNTVIESSFAFNDLSPFSINGETISDEDRAKAARTAYEAAIKRLKQNRRKCYFQVRTEALPPAVSVGDRIRFFYDLNQFNLSECNDELKRILLQDEWFYIAAIDYEIAVDGTQTNTLRLQKDLRIDREVD